MKTILTRGGIEFLAVFLGIALSLWVDDYREERELKERLKIGSVWQRPKDTYLQT